jgi:hypothetical protein
MLDVDKMCRFVRLRTFLEWSPMDSLAHKGPSSRVLLGVRAMADAVLSSSLRQPQVREGLTSV